MSDIPQFCTWDGDPTNGVVPYRPGTQDFGGDDLENDAAAPPIAGEMPDADGWNQFVKQLVSLSRVTGAAKLEVHIVSGAPQVVAVKAMGNTVTTATFTPTDNGTGDTTVSWPAGTFPASPMSPTGITVLDDGTHTDIAATVQVVSATSIRVRTTNGGSAVDVGWTLCVE